MRRLTAFVVACALLVAGAKGLAQAEVVAGTVDSAVIGLLPIGAVARGSLAGSAQGTSYHTYILDVPVGTGRLTLLLDADADLDLAVRYGAEITSYDERGQGGDWDFRDVGTANPATLVLENPGAGRWYVDVFNPLGAGAVGTYRLSVTTGAVTAAPNVPAAVQPVSVPDVCPLSAVLPEAAAYGPPATIHTGTRLVYFGITATVPGVGIELVLDENGEWINEQTGQRWGERETRGTSGGGFTVLRVGYLDQQVAQLSSALYGWDIGTGLAGYSTSWGLVTQAGCAADYWIHPAALATLPSVNTGGVRVLRMPYRVGETIYDAIRIQTWTGSGYTAYVYDLQTGLMVFYGSRRGGTAVITPGAGDRAQVGEGSTQLITIWFVEARDVNVPWQNAPTPAWVGQLGQLRYQGTLTATTIGASTYRTAIEQVVTADARGANWLHVQTLAITQNLQGVPPSTSTTVGSYGPASIGGLWIAPQGLRALQPGQVIDQVESVGATIRVSAVNANQVVITEEGPLHRIDYVYDVGSGILTGYTLTQQVSITQMVYEMHLVQGP